MEPLRPGQCLPLLLIRDEEKKLARVERLGRVSRFMMIAVIVCLGPATNLVARPSACHHLGSPLLRQVHSRRLG
jgi:hypothetical protein